MIKIIIFEPFKTKELSANIVDIVSSLGSFTILPGHAPMVCPVAKGDTMILHQKDSSLNETIELKDCIMHIANNQIQIFF